MILERYYCIGCGFSKEKPYMHAIMEDIGICNECMRDVHTTKDMTFEGGDFIDIVISPFLYDGVASEIVRDFKFNGQRRCGDFLSALAYEKLRDKTVFDEYDLIIPVPLHKKRLSERTFNQSDIIAKRLGRLINKDVDCDGLIRIRETLHQSSLKGRERIENVKNAFVARDTALDGKNIILVDDIYTMGETANECAKALKMSGAGKIAVFTLCKTVMKRKSSLF